MINQLVISQVRDLQYCERDSASGNFSPTLTLAHTPETHPKFHSNEQIQDNIQYSSLISMSEF